MSNENKEYEYVEKKGKRLFIWLIAVLFMVGGISWFFSKTEKVADAAIVHYEEFQELYNTCSKVNTDLCNMKDIPDTDKMFNDFSKANRMNALKTNLNKWVQDYNAKSKMWTRSLWKSSTLPYQLEVTDFNCYN